MSIIFWGILVALGIKLINKGNNSTKKIEERRWDAPCVYDQNNFIQTDNARNLVELEQRRKNTPCMYNQYISQYDFEQIVFQCVKHIRRKIHVNISNAIVYGSVESQSGLTTWNFELDFNDWGNLTGAYWFRSDNNRSLIPRKLADSISQEIIRRLPH